MATGRLTLDDGRSIEVGDRAPGGSKNVTSYGVCSDGQEVVVKVQTVHGRLEHEAIALRFARQHGVRVPGVVGSGRGPDGQFFLALAREHGVRTSKPAGWYRLGRDLASLATVPVSESPLPSLSPSDFAHDHLARLEAVAPLLSAATASRVAEAIDRLQKRDELALCHGDPGSGNYLDNGGVGVILDWEDATIGPFGLDVGRAGFIALLDNGHTGRGPDLHAAVVDGYRAGLNTRAALDRELLEASTIVAGLQFAHDRYVRPLRPDRTAQMAVDTLDAYLG